MDGSAEQVSRGSALVNDAGRCMSEIVDPIGRVSAVVNQISTASAEQAAGVAQVG